jgi:uncharacterized membrane protein
MYGHGGHFGGGHGGPGVFGLLFFVVLIALAAVMAFSLFRLYRTRHELTAGPVQPAARPEDGAVAELRLRYARGEVARDEFLSRLRDLGGQLPEGPPRSEPAA